MGLSKEQIKGVVLAYVAELEQTIKIIEANKKFFGKKDDIDQALQSAKTILENAKKTQGEEGPGKTDDNEYIGKLNQFSDITLGLKKKLTDQSFSQDVYNFGQTIKYLKEKPNRTPEEEKELVDLQNDVQIKGPILLKLQEFLNESVNAQKLLEEITHDQNKYTALPPQIRNAFDTYVYIFFKLQNQIIEYYLIMEGI